MSPIRRTCHFRLLALAALALPFPASGQEEQDPARLVPAQSFSGAYLAARLANANNDVPAAIDYSQQALTFAPDNAQMEEDLLLLLLANNEFAKAVPLAANLQDNPQIGRASRLTLVADAFNNQNFDQIPPLLELEEPDLMDDLIAELMRAWALYGKGDSAGAINALEEMEGPAWYDLFRHYHLALIYRLAGDKTRAQAAFEQALESQIGGSSSPDNYGFQRASPSNHQAARGR